MTRNQIDYLRYQEDARANRAQEEIAATRSARDYELGSAQLAETVRAHQAQEQHNVQVLGETRRSNLAREKETNRANLMQEALADARNVELGRHNVAMEAFQRDELSENQRRNRAQEEETMRSNLARELENTRANQAREEETRRSNKAQESHATAALVEKTANDAASRALEGTRQAETKRANMASEALQAARTAAELLKAQNLKGAFNVNNSSSQMFKPSTAVNNRGQSPLQIGKEQKDVSKPSKEFQPNFSGKGTSRSKGSKQKQNPKAGKTK